MKSEDKIFLCENYFNIKAEQKEKKFKREDYGAGRNFIKNESNAIYIFLQIHL